MPALKISAIAEWEGEVELMKKKDFYTATFEIGVVPVELALGFSLSFKVEAYAKSSITFACDYVRTGGAGFTYHDGRAYNTKVSGSTSGGLKVASISLLQVSAKLILEPTLHLTFYEFVPIIFQINPYIRFQIISNPTKACRIGFNTTWGVEGSVGVGEMELFDDEIWDGATYDFDIVEETEIESWSGLCILKARRFANQYLTIETGDQVIPGVVQAGETISDAEIVYRRWNFTSDLLDYYDGITFYLSFSTSCQVAYGSSTVELAKQKFHITFPELIAANGTDITFAIHKNITESVSLSYVLKRTRIPFGESVKLRAGVVSIKPPAIIPDYLAIKLGAGQMTFFADGTTVNTLSPVTLASYPFKTNYLGPDTTIIIYPVYNANSGDQVRHVFDGVQTKIAIVYTANSGMQNSLYSFMINPTISTQESVSLKISTDSSFSIQNLITMPNAVQVEREGISLNSIPKVIYVELVSDVVGVELLIEPLEIYKLELSTETVFKYSALGPFVLAVTKTSTFGELGMVVEMESDTQSYIGHKIPTEEIKQSALYVSTGTRKNNFGISKYSYSILMSRPYYVRVESRSVVKGEATLTAGSVKFSELKNENITVSVKFTKLDGQYSDILDVNSLMNGDNVYLVIKINDLQYTCNSYYISSTVNVVKFLTTLRTKEVLSNWNQVILPNLAYYASNPKLLNVSLADPQTMLIKIPQSLNFKSGTEVVSFSSISTHMFIPEPLQVSSLNELSANTYVLTPGDIGAIIASVLGFSIIVVLIIALGVVCFLWKSKKATDSATTKDVELGSK